MGRPGRAWALQSDRMVHRIAKCKIPALRGHRPKPRQHSGQPVFRLRMAHGRGRVALGTVIAQYCGLTLSLYYCHRMHHRLGLPYTFVPSSVFRKTPLAVSSVSTATFSCAPFASCASLSISPPPVPVKGIYLSGQCLADAILHPLFLFHGRFRLCRRSPLGQMCRCGEIIRP